LAGESYSKTKISEVGIDCDSHVKRLSS